MGSLAISVGDAASPTRYLDSDTTAQDGGTQTTIASTGRFHRNTAETEILLTVTAAAGTPVAGTYDVYLQGYVGS